MRPQILLCLTCVVGFGLAAVGDSDGRALQPRQDSTNAETNSGFPTLTSNDGSQPTSTSAEAEETSNTVTSEESTVTTSSSSRQTDSTSSKPLKTSSSASASASSSSTSTLSAGNSTATDGPSEEHLLPIKPEITPAFSVAGVFLMLTGVVYGLVGVKNRWIHIFLSTAYLVSLSVTVLIDYVMKPPISNAIQGAYFVAIFMTGVIFGAGALVFKEMTEGLGCLLGGFCLAMWLLTLKSGGLITSATGKGIFVAAMSVVGWSLSFSHYTRAYGLIVSISFAGSTAFVLGIDCFSRAGLKEFWIYIWGLNENIFPLYTDTYPITRGIRVETVVILLCAIIGVMSQMKLWMVLKERQRQREAARLEHNQQRDVVEEELGRNLERKTEVDRANWEQQYGSRPQSKRNTILWTDAHPEKRYSRVPPIDAQAVSKASASSESVELSDLEPRKTSSTKEMKDKAESSVTVETIEEEQQQDSESSRTQQEQGSLLESTEDRTRSLKGNGQEVRPSLERQKALDALEQPRSPTAENSSISRDLENQTPVVVPLPFKIPGVEDQPQSDGESFKSAKHNVSASASKRASRRISQNASVKEDRRRSKRVSKVELHHEADRESNIEPRRDPKRESKIESKRGSWKGSRKTSRRHSLQSVLSRSSHHSSEQFPPSESQEALMLPELHHSRASSVAATLDGDNEYLRTHSMMRRASRESILEQNSDQTTSKIAPEDNLEADELLNSIVDSPPSPPALSSSSEQDPEELSRPLPVETAAAPNRRTSAYIADKKVETPKSPTKLIKPWADEQSQSERSITQTSENDGLTRGALDQVPSQLSNVVLSYRTNEWAKHISVADAPMFDEPQLIEGEEDEAPVQIVPPSPPTVKPVIDSKQTLAATSKPPAPYVNNNDDYFEERKPRPKSRSFSDQQLDVIGAAATPKAVATYSSKSASNKNKRNSLTIDHLKQSLVTSPIDENEPADFAPPQPAQQRGLVSQPSRGLSSTSVNMTNLRNGMRSPSPPDTSRNTLNRPSSRNGLAAAYQRSGSAMSNHSDMQLDSRPGSAMGSRPVIRTDTRMNSYESHQPRRRDRDLEAERRETLLTEWRVSQHQGSVINTIPQVGVETRRSQMLIDREHKRVTDDRQRVASHQKQFAMDQAMRRPDMQDLHRAAMRKLQASANKKL